MMRSVLPLAVLVLAGCAGDPAAAPHSATASSPAAIARGSGTGITRNGADIPLTSEGTTRPHTVLEDMTATARQITVFGRVPTRADVDSDLRKRAAELGADAVINVRYGNQGVGLVSWNQISGTGQAVRYTRP